MDERTTEAQREPAQAEAEIRDLELRDEMAEQIQGGSEPTNEDLKPGSLNHNETVVSWRPR